MNKLLIMLFAVLFLAQSVLGANYYVSTTGSNSNPGTQTAPWNTIQYAENTAPSGSIVYILDGTYTERVVVDKPNLIFRGYNYQTAISNGGFKIIAQDVTVDRLRVTTSAVSSSSPLWAGYAIYIVGDRARITNNYIYDVLGGSEAGGSAIYGEWGWNTNTYSRNVLISNNTIYNVGMGIQVLGDSWIVENNEVNKLYKYGNGDTDYSRFFGDNHIIKNNYYHGTDINTIGDSHVDCFQTFDSTSWITHTRNVTFINNTCYDFHQGIMASAQYNKNTYGITLRGNVFANFQSGFISTSHGVIFEDIPYVDIQHNTFINTGVRSILFNTISTSNNYLHHETVKNNLFYQTGSPKYNFPSAAQSTSVGGYNLMYPSGYSSPTYATDFIANPQFIDFNNKDFRPVLGSPACTGSSTGSYIGALPCVGSSSYHVADTNNDMCISLGEISAYVSRWLNGSITLSQVSSSVSEWFGGC